MADRFTEVTYESWFSRIMGSIKSVLVGILLFLVAFPLLWWNEGRAIATERSLKEGAGMVVSVSTDKVDEANEGKLVHMTGEASTEETVTDPIFGISANAIMLRRNVQMYQWVETKKSTSREKLGGGKETVTTYEYKQEWTDKFNDSDKFKERVGHTNPGAMPFEKLAVTAKDVKLGAFQLSESLVTKIDKGDTISLKENDLEKLSPEVKDKAKLVEGVLYIGENTSAPKIGDTKVSFQEVKPTTVSIIARQQGSTFEPYTTSNGETLELIQIGTVSADLMFKQALAENSTITWILRLVGFFLMWIGLASIFSPLTVIASVLPFIGDLLGLGVGIFSALVSLGLSLLTIALAWLFYRPLISIPLIVIGVGAIIGLKVLTSGKKATART